MALVLRGKTRCALCKLVLGQDDELFTTSAFLSRAHPLWRYSDAAMHLESFRDWSERDAFLVEARTCQRDRDPLHQQCVIGMLLFLEQLLAGRVQARAKALELRFARGHRGWRIVGPASHRGRITTLRGAHRIGMPGPGVIVADDRGHLGG